MQDPLGDLETYALVGESTESLVMWVVQLRKSALGG